jgi:hypothetical protein
MMKRRMVFGALLACAFGLTARLTPAQTATAQQARVCANAPEYRQLDFWVGEWEVRNSAGQPAAGQAVASSSVQRIIDSCVVYENYSEGEEFLGKSFNFYDAHLRKWRQTWVDNTGRVSEFLGEYREGAMRFEGESHLPDGRRVLRHMTIFDLAPGRVRQLSEASTDGGKTWRVTYDYTYLRKK